MTNEEAWNKFFAEAGEIEQDLLDFLTASHLRGDTAPFLEWSAVHLRESVIQPGIINSRTLYCHYANGHSECNFIVRNEAEALIHAEIKRGHNVNTENFRIIRHIKFVDIFTVQPK